MILFNNQFNKKTYQIIASVTIAVILILGFLVLGNYFSEVMLIVSFIVFGILLLFFTIAAGLAVLKALFYVAAEISLLIYLSKSYCEVPASKLTLASNNALKSLLVVGGLYIVISFGKSLIDKVKSDYKNIESEKWSWEKVTTVAFYLLFAFLIVWQIYRVIGPIIVNLCIY